MIESTSIGENLLSIPEAARLLPGRVHLSTMRRYYLRGLNGIRLETVLIAGKRWTTPAALNRFIESTQPATAPNGADPAADTSEVAELLEVTA